MRRCHDSFVMQTKFGHHHCHVYEPLGMSLLDYVNIQDGKRLTADAVGFVATCVLLGLDYVHDCGVVHAGEYIVNGLAKHS